jgi:hypothetical protein
MALVIKDRVKQTSTTTGTGTLTLNGTVDGFQTFAAALSDGDTTYYALLEPSTNEWEVGLGTWTEGSSFLARTTILASSNSGSAVSLTAQSEVFITQPATKAAFFNADGDLALTRDPQSALQAATKQYVDTIAAAGIHYHDPVRVESPINLNATYDNGTSGVGATLTNAGTQAAITIDGVALSSADRVLIYNQTNAAHNGIYTVTTVGDGSTNWVLTRATDADSYGVSDPNAFGEGDAFFVKEGDTGAGELYVMNTSGTITFGTTNITFSVIAETAVYSAGNGVTLTGTTFSADAGTGVTVDGSGINIGQAVETTSDVTFNSVAAALTGNVTGNVTGDVTGNADTATALETARNIGGVSFDGTASINLPGVNTAGNQDTTGNAATATAWETGRTISLTGDVTGSVTGVDGSGNASIATTIAANSVALGTDTTGDYVSTVTSGNYLTGGTTGEGSTPTLNVDATPNNTASKVVARDASGNFSAGTVTAALSGNASTASTLATARNIAVTGAVTGNANFDGSGNISIATTATSDPTVTLTGAVTGSGTMTNLGNVSIATTATADPTLTLSGDASGSATFTNLGNATLTVTVADDSHNHVISNVDGLQTALDGKQASGTYNTVIGTDSDINTSGSTIIDNIFVTDGVITSMGTRTLTLGDIGALSTSGKAADSNLLDGLDLHTGTNNQANKVVRTNGSGYADFGWINTTSGDTTSGLSRIYVDTGDGYIRKSTLAHVASQGGYHVNSYSNNMTANQALADDWFRSIGATGWYNNTYAGGIYMEDSTWVRIYGSKQFLVDNKARADSWQEAYTAKSGTSVTLDADTSGAFSLSMSGNTTFTFSAVDSSISVGFILQLTGNGSTVTWPSSVKWAGGTAPDAPASGETDVLVFHTRDGGTNWYGVLSSDAAA